ncbi:cell envelope-associated transcriptional attenuator LytR-CpsA-Psr [Halalkalibacter wakoensis JCM 9140]|uniref:Cell envelope-associated transcriptional attenuator LytR-CpsA-Psr n=1 Tax=Halalkalibacter wakoensis JCM 9140 TaxID=1236970 RepID=W4Q8X5_9BACI|nr:LCP family protein [Halalkalibacter wakoensis]GAE28407.1 cell envelope-associated transcriptional attenuator LytR-CpsA-Psr [Halalkalibacter wakoensis JCM 9140]
MSQSRVRKRKQKSRKILRIALLVAILTFLGAGGVLSYFVITLSDVAANSQEELDRGEKSEKREEVVDPGQDNISVLFLGVDDRDGDLRGRTDAMLLGTFNRQDSSIKILSIPRDTLVTIPGRANQDKINHAHAFGGLDLTVDTVEHFLEVPVDYYVNVNFTAFMEIVDALGGVELDVPFTFTEQDSSGRHGAITLHEGTHVLNGEEALAFVRMRKNDPTGDIGRGQRQQQLIEAILKKGASLSSITSYNSLLDSVDDHMTTNLSFSNMVAFHSYITSLNDIEMVNFEGTDTRMNGVYYYEVTETSRANTVLALQRHLGLIEPKEEETAY